MRRIGYGLWVLWVVSGMAAWDRPARAADVAFVVGACTHFSQGKGILDRNLERIKQAGIASIRDEVGWGAVEREKGKLAMPEQFDTYVRQAAAQGVNVLLILDYANRFYDDGDRPRSPEAIEGFCRYAEFVVRHFGKAGPAVRDLERVGHQHRHAPEVSPRAARPRTTSSCSRPSIRGSRPPIPVSR